MRVTRTLTTTLHHKVSCCLYLEKNSKNHSSGHIQLVCGAFSNHLVTQETRMTMIIIRVTDGSDWLIHCSSQTCE